MTTTSTAVEHGITVDVVRLPAGNPYRASCLCGWQSQIVGARPNAVRAGAQHYAETNRPEPISGPIACASWCMYGDGHTDVWAKEDQWCGSTVLRVDLSTHPVLEDSVLTADGWTSSPDHVEVCAMRLGSGATTTVDVSRAGGPQMSFTPDEARQLVEALQLVLGQIEAGR